MLKVILKSAAVAANAATLNPFPKVSDFNLEVTKSQLDKYLASRPGTHQGNSDNLGRGALAQLLFDVRVRKAYLDWFQPRYPGMIGKWNFWLHATAQKFFNGNSARYKTPGELVTAFIKQFSQKAATAQLKSMRASREQYDQVMDNIKYGTPSTVVSAGRSPRKDQLAAVISIFKSLKLDAIKALQKLGFKMSKVRGTAGTYQIEDFDGNARRSVQSGLEKAGFKVKQAQDRHGNTNLVVDRVFKDFMNLDLQVCSISSTGKLFVPPRRLTGLETKMLKAFLASGVYAVRQAAMPATASADALASKDSAKVTGAILALNPEREFHWERTPIAEALKDLSTMKGFEFGKDWKWSGDVPDDECDIHVSGVDKKHSSFYGPMALVALLKYFSGQVSASVVVTAEDTGQEKWAKGMLAAIQTVDPKVKSGADGMESDEGYVVSLPVAKKIIAALVAANFHGEGSETLAVGNRIIFFSKQAKDRLGVEIEANTATEGKDALIRWYDRSFDDTLRVFLAQTVPNSDKVTDHQWVNVKDMAAASKACINYIESNNLGASTWAGGLVVRQSKSLVAVIAFNGKKMLPTDDAVKAYVKRYTKWIAKASDSAEADDALAANRPAIKWAAEMLKIVQSVDGDVQVAEMLNPEHDGYWLHTSDAKKLVAAFAKAKYAVSGDLEAFPKQVTIDSKRNKGCGLSLKYSSSMPNGFLLTWDGDFEIAASDVAVAATGMMSKWAVDMLKVIKTADPKADGGVGGMASSDGYYVSIKMAKAIVAALTKAGYEPIGALTKPSGQVTIDCKTSKDCGLSLQIDDESNDAVILNWYNEAVSSVSLADESTSSEWTEFLKGRMGTKPLKELSIEFKKMKADKAKEEGDTSESSDARLLQAWKNATAGGRQMFRCATAAQPPQEFTDLRAWTKAVKAAGLGVGSYPRYPNTLFAVDKDSEIAFGTWWASKSKGILHSKDSPSLEEINKDPVEAEAKLKALCDAIKNGLPEACSKATKDCLAASTEGETLVSTSLSAPKIYDSLREWQQDARRMGLNSEYYHLTHSVPPIDKTTHETLLFARAQLTPAQVNDGINPWETDEFGMWVGNSRTNPQDGQGILFTSGHDFRVWLRRYNNNRA